ncbi:hypothetical protein VW35_00505 [Devosia soli]|uniref:Uncharacterized protein n=1 Tax=Devosia soli TaxID=361041 RepID=A0A0F5LL66_9HYPH|nr:hypothetical protein VW35_00505 [Devosia soli]
MFTGSRILEAMRLGASAEAHGFKNAAACEHRIGRLAAAAMPFEPGTMAVALDLARTAHAAPRTTSLSLR